MSNIIYDKSHHYVYKITELSTNRKYIGVRSSNISPNQDLGIKYFSSSKDKLFINNQKNNSANYKYEVLSEFIDRKDAINEEIRLHELYNVSNNPEFINRSNQKSSSFDTSGMTAVIDDDGNKFMISLTDPRYLSGDVVAVLSNKTTVKDNDGNTFHVDIDDPRYLSGELVGVTKGYVAVKHKDDFVSKGFLVSVDDPRYLSGELIPPNKNMMTVKDECGNYMSVYKDDPRYLSGELKHISSGKIVVKDNDGNNKQVDVTDPRYLSGEYQSVNKGIVIVKDKSGKTFSTSINDPRYISGEYIHINKGRTASDETKRKQSLAAKNKVFSKETIMKIQEAKKNTPRIHCIHCDKKLMQGYYDRWHGDKCKKKKVI